MTVKNKVMKIKWRALMFLLMMSVSSAGSCLFSQDNQQKPTRQSSRDAFSKGNYEQAYMGFSELLKIYTKDPLYKYYCGACLVELKRSPSEALKWMEQALQTATVVKPLPEDARFYLGRAEQMSGKYSAAIKSFNLYTGEAGKKASRGKGVEELIKQCKEGKGEIKEVPVIASEKTQKETVPAAKPENKTGSVAEVTSAAVIPAAAMVTAATAEPVVPPTVVVPVQGKNLSYEKLIDQGMEFQFLADSLHDLTAIQKKEIEKLSEPQKAGIVKKIEENEKLEESYQSAADQKFADAKAVSVSGQEKPAEKAKANQPPALVAVVAAPVQEKVKDSAVVNPPVSPVVPIATPLPEKPKEAVTSSPVVNNRVAAPPVELFSLFEVMPGPEQGQASKKPAESEFRMKYTYDGKNWWDPDAKITIDPPVASGLIYRIQIAVFRNPVKPSFFKGLAPVYGFRIEGTDKTIYYAGMFRKLTDANKALASVKAKGFADAFVVPLSDNKKIPSDKAATMEKEWGRKSFISVMEATGNQKPAMDTIPPTLSFRVEVVKAQKPLKEDAVDGIKKVAGNRGVDIQTFENGSCAYLIGKFITFESASEYSDLLIKNGYREARVVAFLGSKEIPVETAKQLFEK